MISRNILGFSITRNMMRVMSINNCYASIMRAEKRGKQINGLPLGIPIPVLPVDYLKDRPDFWIGGQGSYVCPVESDWALWFNWQMNNSDTAILTSVKGMNPLSGCRVNHVQLEQYQNKCPIHGCDLQHGNFCPECNYKWPNQNYICDPNPMYLDGFRSDDGHVRQFYFTEDMAKSVPELIIGMDDTVPAFGFCFYKLKKQNTNYEDGKRLHEIPDENELRYGGAGGGMMRGSAFTFPGSYTTTRSAEIRTKRSIRYSSSCLDSVRGSETKGLSLRSTSFSSSPRLGASLDESSVNFASCESEPVRGIGYGDPVSCVDFSSMDVSKLAKSMENPLRERLDYKDGERLESSIDKSKLEVGVGAGVQIKQRIVSDRYEVSAWNEEPNAIMRIYFVFREQFEKYAASGLKDLVGQKEGFLDSLPVGGK